MTIAEYCSTTRAEFGAELIWLPALSSACRAIKLHRSVLNKRQCLALGRGPKRGLRKGGKKGQPSMQRD